MMKSAQTHSPTRFVAGFTLIELLVTVSIAVVMLGLGIAGFLRFNERQLVKNAATEVQTMMRTAQSRAQVQEIPANQPCDQLIGYRVRRNGNQVELHTHCDEGYYLRDSYSIPDGTTLADTFDEVEFFPLQGGANLVNASGTGDQAELQINTNNGDDIEYQFTVTSSGSISEGGFVTN